MMWPSSSAPTNWLICNGQSFSSSEYPDLYSVLGTTFVPDFRGRMALGAGRINTPTSDFRSITTINVNLKSSGGHDVYQLNEKQTPDHRHYVPADGNFPDTWGIGGFLAGGDEWSAEGGGYGKVMMSSSPLNHSGWIDNMPPYYSVNFIIKAK